MNHMKQKIISVLLCLVLILMPLSATAMHQCVSKDADIWCDICGEWMEHECIDSDGDAYCELCLWIIPHLCIDGDEDRW